MFPVNSTVESFLILTHLSIRQHLIWVLIEHHMQLYEQTSLFWEYDISCHDLCNYLRFLLILGFLL